ncbi:hypothetical protein, variant [Capsaspora owczarzaki ATCC 30864]|nr:hypothetical protein, variant [Capsaspora owczarzaki ATCC 30864]
MTSLPTLPLELLELILGDPAVSVRDLVAVSATCRALRDVVELGSDAIWRRHCVATFSVDESNPDQDTDAPLDPRELTSIMSAAGGDGTQVDQERVHEAARARGIPSCALNPTLWRTADESRNDRAAAAGSPWRRRYIRHHLAFGHLLPTYTRMRRAWRIFTGWLRVNSPRIHGLLRPGTLGLLYPASKYASLTQAVLCLYRMNDGQNIGMPVFGTAGAYDEVRDLFFPRLRELDVLGRQLIRFMGAPCIVMPLLEPNADARDAPLLDLISFDSKGLDGFQTNSLTEWIEGYARDLASTRLIADDNGVIDLFPTFGEGVSTATTNGIQISMSSLPWPSRTRLHENGSEYGFIYKLR